MSQLCYAISKEVQGIRMVLITNKKLPKVIQRNNKGTASYNSASVKTEAWILSWGFQAQLLKHKVSVTHLFPDIILETPIFALFKELKYSLKYIDDLYLKLLRNFCMLL